MLPLTSRHRDRIVDREVMKLRLREEQRRDAEGVRLHAESRARPPLILVAVEPHDNAAALATVAAASVLAAALGAELILAGVAPLGPAPMGGDRQATIDAATHRQVTEAARRLPPDIPRRTMLRWGAAGPAIVGAARQEAVDLVVVSIQDGADPYVLHHSDVPVLVVPVYPPADAAA